MGKNNQPISREEFIIRSIETHGDACSYERVVYVDSKTKVELFCNYHQEYFWQTPKIHKKSSCPKCGRERQIESAKDGKEGFVKKAINVYGDLDDYSKVEYVNNKTEVILICKEHGEYRKRPDFYLQGSRCTSCRKKTSKMGNSKYSNRELFIEAGEKFHGKVTDYSKVETITDETKVELRCLKHDHTYEISVSNHLSGQKCPTCAMENYALLRKKTTEQFIKEAVAVHGEDCDYSETVYISCREKLTVKCNKHDIFFDILPANHIAGTKCRKCFSENQSKLFTGKEGVCGYTKSGYVKQANGREACVYLIRCWDENEEFYKIGKTFLNIKTRFKKSNLCYDFEEVHFIYGEAGYIYDLENRLHRKYKPYKHRPEKWFAGHTECYTLNLPIKEIMDI